MARWRSEIHIDTLPPGGLLVVHEGTVWIEDSEGNVLLEFESFDEYSGIQVIGGSLQEEFEASYGDPDRMGTAIWRLVETLGWIGQYETDPDFRKRIQRYVGISDGEVL